MTPTRHHQSPNYRQKFLLSTPCKTQHALHMSKIIDPSPNHTSEQLTNPQYFVIRRAKQGRARHRETVCALRKTTFAPCHMSAEVFRRRRLLTQRLILHCDKSASHRGGSCTSDLMTEIFHVSSKGSLLTLNGMANENLLLNAGHLRLAYAART